MSQDHTLLRARSRSFIIAAVAALLVIPFAGGFAKRSMLQAQTLQKPHGVEFISASASGTPESRKILAALKALLNPNETIFPSTGSNHWDKWLNEDVAYLITPDERAAVLALKSDAEREQFVNQFWEKRNPAPGSTVNAFKNEHYRRIAFANDRFAAQDAPGWQTDRGRTYILLGPPDEIESYPNQNRETWIYRSGITIEFNTSHRPQS